ncbi:DnaD domain-containing protein [Gorillibacterium sp. CAU 1737]|uniref:DnaD domain-containing protein n=1 Tax=Gorillibacterium sp. CAU 1737 TaxID=3140362 RepID=UPI0032602447
MKGTKASSGKAFEEGLKAGLSITRLEVPTLFLTGYRELGLSDTEAMLLLQLMTYLDKEANDFPTPDELGMRMSATPESIIGGLARLIKNDWLTIEEGIERPSGIRFERYSLDPLYAKLAAWWRKRIEEEEASTSAASPPETGQNLFLIFEKEFARPLTPMELEMISGWLDQDRFPEDLILAALKEAVFAGKVHFRYIDRILLEWQRNRVLTVEQAKEHRQKFRGRS